MTVLFLRCILCRPAPSTQKDEKRWKSKIRRKNRRQEKKHDATEDADDGGSIDHDFMQRVLIWSFVLGCRRWGPVNRVNSGRMSTRSQKAALQNCKLYYLCSCHYNLHINLSLKYKSQEHTHQKCLRDFWIQELKKKLKLKYDKIIRYIRRFLSKCNNFCLKSGENVQNSRENFPKPQFSGKFTNLHWPKNRP